MAKRKKDPFKVRTRNGELDLTQKALNARRVWSNARDLRSILEQAGKASRYPKLIEALKRLEKASYREFKNAKD